MPAEELIVHGAREHNLKDVTVVLPRNKLICITGLSGSGKSSLAFDTIYAEGQRRYVESLSAYARQFLERMEKPDVDEISGIAPAVAIRQKNATRNPRSNVATATEIYDYLRLLFARCGQTFCIKCGAEVPRDSPDEIATRILSLTPGRRFYVLHQFRMGGPAASGHSKRGGKKTPAGPPQDTLRQALLDLQKRGFNRLYQAGRIHEFSSPETLLDVDFSKAVYVLVDRLAVNPESRARLVDSIEICYREGQGEAILEFIADSAGIPGERLTFNERFECKNDGTLHQEPEPRLFSFNNPYGACPRCQGFGNTIDFDLNLVVPDPSKSLDDGAIEPWTKPRYRALFQDAKKWARARGIPVVVSRIAFQNQAALLGGKLPPVRVGGDAPRARPLLRILEERPIARLGPWFNGSVIEGLACIGDHEIQIEVDGVAETLAPRTRSVRIVEREKSRLGLLMERAVILAFESLVECQALGGIPRAICDEFEYGFALAFAVADLDRVHQPRARFRIDGQTVDQHIHRFRKVHIEQRFRRGEFVDAACLIQPVEPALLKIQQRLPKRILRRTGSRFLPTAFRVAGRCWPAHSKLVQHVKAAPRRERQNPRGNFVGAVPGYFRAAFDAKRLSAAREE